MEEERVAGGGVRYRRHTRLQVPSPICVLNWTLFCWSGRQIVNNCANCKLINNRSLFLSKQAVAASIVVVVVAVGRSKTISRPNWLSYRVTERDMILLWWVYTLGRGDADTRQVKVGNNLENKTSLGYFGWQAAVDKGQDKSYCAKHDKIWGSVR